MLRKLDAQTIQGLVAALPDVFREVIVLREIEDMSYREIAEIVSTPVGTVMSRLARGRAMLREAWIKAERESGQKAEQKAGPAREREEHLK
jgi:RNA polymerase sigma-70 factor (ECF subfamily)